MEKGLGFGLILTVFIGVIVGIVLFQASADQIGNTAIKVTTSNALYTAPAAGVTIDLVGQELLNTPTVTNRTSGGTVSATNYTIFEGVSPTTGVKTIRYKTLAGSEFAGKEINVSYQYGTSGYVEDTGTVAVIGLILIFAALAIAVIALVPTLRSGVLTLIGK